MRPGKKFTIGFLPTLLCLMAMLVTACGGGGGTGNTSAKPTPAPQSQQLYRYWLLGPDIATFDPALVQDADSIYAIDGVFTGMVALNNQLQVIPEMASSWDKSTDGLTWTFHLRSGLQFSDGSPLGAQDIAYSIDRALQKATQSPVALTYLGLIKDSDKLSAGSIKTIIGDSLVVKDATTLQITLNKPGAYFLEALTYPTSFPVEQSVVTKYGTKWTDHLTDNGGQGGDGPFVVKSYSHTKGIVEIPNSKYFGPKPIIQLQLPFYADSDTAYQAYQANQLDFTGVPAAHLATDKTLKDFQKVPQLWIDYFAMNYLTKPFDNIKIRQAFELAVDKDEIVHDILKDKYIPSNHIVPAGMPGYFPGLTGPAGSTTHGNQAMAKTLLQQGLAEEGWTSAAQLPTIKLTYPATSQDTKNVVSALVQRWQTVLGVTVVPDPVDFGKLLDEINAATNNAKGIQFWSIGWIADYPDPQDWTTLQFDKGSPNNNSNYGQNNSTTAAEQVTVQQQLEAADITQDPTARFAAINKAEQALINDVAWFPTYQVSANIRIKPYVVGYVLNAQELVPPDYWASIYIAQH